jgi:hypothetical protein
MYRLHISRHNAIGNRIIPIINAIKPKNCILTISIVQRFSVSLSNIIARKALLIDLFVRLNIFVTSYFFDKDNQSQFNQFCDFGNPHTYCKRCGGNS